MINLKVQESTIKTGQVTFRMHPIALLFAKHERTNLEWRRGYPLPGMPIQRGTTGVDVYKCYIALATENPQVIFEFRKLACVIRVQRARVCPQRRALLDWGGPRYGGPFGRRSKAIGWGVRTVKRDAAARCALRTRLPLVAFDNIRTGKTSSDYRRFCPNFFSYVL